MFLRIFSYSFKKLVKTLSVWVFFIVNISLSLLAAVILPLCNNNIEQWINFDRDYSLILLGILALHSSMIGESNADPIERVFILARPIKRTTYLWSKICSTFVITTLLSLCLMLIWLLSARYITDRPFEGYSQRIAARDGYIDFNYEAISFICIFIIATCTGAFGTIYRLYMKNKISSIIAMVFVMGIYMVYSITFSTSQDPITIEELKMYYYVKYLIFPAGIAAISIGLVFYGFYLNKKEDIRI